MNAPSLSFTIHGSKIYGACPALVTVGVAQAGSLILKCPSIHHLLEKNKTVGAELSLAKATKLTFAFARLPMTGLTDFCCMYLVLGIPHQNYQ